MMSRCLSCVCGSDLIRSAAARKEVPIVVAVQRQIQHVRITVESLLGAVAMVNVLKDERDDVIWCLLV